MSDTKPTGNIELGSLFSKETGLHFRIAHRLMIQFRLDLPESQFFLRNTAVLTADTIELESWPFPAQLDTENERNLSIS